jgi:hypothetical protein
LSLHIHLATTSDPMRWRGSSAEHVCWRRSVAGRGATSPFRRTPATTPSPSEPGPSLYLRPLGRYSSGARGATAVQASALEASISELIDAIFGCYPSSKAAEEAVPSTCVGDARPCAGRGATRARSTVPQRPRQVRATQVRPCTGGRWGATAPALEARRRYEQVRWNRL